MSHSTKRCFDEMFFDQMSWIPNKGVNLEQYNHDYIIYHQYKLYWIGVKVLLFDKLVEISFKRKQNTLMCSAQKAFDGSILLWVRE